MPIEDLEYELQIAIEYLTHHNQRNVCCILVLTSHLGCSYKRPSSYELSGLNNVVYKPTEIGTLFRNCPLFRNIVFFVLTLLFIV